MPVEDWEAHYAQLLDEAQAAVGFAQDMTFELITHRFTPGSKDVLQSWYPKTTLDMTEETRAEKRNKFGGVKYVYPPDMMKSLRRFFEARDRPPLPAGAACCIGLDRPPGESGFGCLIRWLFAVLLKFAL